MTKFIYDRNTGLADATLFSMFRFPDSPQVHFQCDIAVCRGKPIRSVISDYDLGFDLGYSVPFNSTRPVQLTYMYTYPRNFPRARCFERTERQTDLSL